VLIIDDGKLVAGRYPAAAPQRFSARPRSTSSSMRPMPRRAPRSRRCGVPPTCAAKVAANSVSPWMAAPTCPAGGVQARVARGWVLLEMAQTVPVARGLFLRLTAHDAETAMKGQLEEVANA